MTDINRLQQLSGRKPVDDTIKVLQQEAQAVQESYNVTIDALKNGRQIDEGLFTNLMAAVKTAGSIGKAGATAVADKAKKIGAQVKNIYLDKKAQLELTKLVKRLKTSLNEFNQIETESPTIVTKDAEVKKALGLFRDIFTKTIQLLQARQAVTEGVELTQAGIEKFLAESEQLDEAAMKPKRVVIKEGPYRGKAGLMVFSKMYGDVRYYVVELDDESGFGSMPPVTAVFNGDWDDEK